MKWTLKEIDNVAPVALYDLAHAHDLVPDNILAAVEKYKAVASQTRMFHVEHDSSLVATILVSGITDDEDCFIDFVPEVKKFAHDTFQEPLREAVIPLLTGLFEKHNLKRITAQVPGSRTRTKKAIMALGFTEEGRLREAVQFRGKKCEDMLIFGLLRRELVEERDGILQ